MTEYKREIIEKVKVDKLRKLLHELPKYYPKDAEVNQSLGEAPDSALKRARKAECGLPCWGCILCHYLRPSSKKHRLRNNHYAEGKWHLAELLGLEDSLELNSLLEVLERNGEPCAKLAFGAYADAYDENGHGTPLTTLETVINVWNGYADRIEKMQGEVSHG